jgi:hypothetical protein
MKRRALLYLLILVFLVAGLTGCRKNPRISKSLVVPMPQSDYDRVARIILGLCDPAKPPKWLKNGSDATKTYVQATCAVGMEKIAPNLDQIKNPRLIKLVLEYRELKLRSDNVQQKKD